MAAEYFQESDITVNILNPARVRKYAQGIGILAKTDRIDSYVIERYTREVKPKVNFESSKSQLMLKRLVTRRSSLKNMIIAEKNRKKTADKIISRSIDRVTKLLEKEVAEIDKAIDKVLEQDLEIQNKVDVLTKQKGIAKVTACNLVGLMPELGYLNNQQVASLSGLAPFSRDSGKMKDVYNRLTNRGKPPKVALVAVMRKMIITANINMKLYYKNLQ